MAVNTAGQTARPRPAYSNAAHARMSRNPSPQSGGDVGGPRGFLAGRGIPTSGGTAKPGAPYVTDRHNDQGGKRLYLGKAFSNAQRPPFPYNSRTKGNSVGRNELLENHVSNTAVKKAANQRLVSRDDRETQVKGHDEYAGLPFRKSSGAYGPVKGERATRGRDHGEHESRRKF